MECNNFIWETALSFLDFKDRLTFRLLSKTFNHLALNTLTDLYIDRKRSYSPEFFKRFGPYAKHLHLDTNDLELEFFPNELKKVNTVTFGSWFEFRDYDNCFDCSDEERTKDAFKMVREMNLDHIYMLAPTLDYYVFDLIDKKDLTSFAFSAYDVAEDAELILNKLSFHNLRTLMIHCSFCGKELAELIKSKSINLRQLEFFSIRMEEEDVPCVIPNVSSLEVFRFCLVNQEDGFLFLDNSERLPNLVKLDIFQKDKAKFELRNFSVWPQITALRIGLKHFQPIDFKKFFPNLKELSFNLQLASPTQASSFFSSIENLKSLFITCPDNFEFPSHATLQSLSRLSLKFESEVSPTAINWISRCLPNLIELSVISKGIHFEKAYLENYCRFDSLVRFVTSNQFNYGFWAKFIAESPRLADIHMGDWLDNRAYFRYYYPHITINPFYNLESFTFEDFLPFY